MDLTINSRLQRFLLIFFVIASVKSINNERDIQLLSGMIQKYVILHDIRDVVIGPGSHLNLNMNFKIFKSMIQSTTPSKQVRILPLVSPQMLQPSDSYVMQLHVVTHKVSPDDLCKFGEISAQRQNQYLVKMDSYSDIKKAVGNCSLLFNSKLFPYYFSGQENDRAIIVTEAYKIRSDKELIQRPLLKYKM